MYSGAGYGCCWESDRTNISRYSCQQCDMKYVAFFSYGSAFRWPWLTGPVRWMCHMDRTTCCLEYEFCVSCCLNPSQEQRVASWLQLNIEGTTRTTLPTVIVVISYHPRRSPDIRFFTFQPDSREREEMAPLSRFEQCLALCRTSSASILRQHVFISPSHFCYAGVPS
jgi:hypothetical protein